jgi:hypothetical protein
MAIELASDADENLSRLNGHDTWVLYPLSGLF